MLFLLFFFPFYLCFQYCPHLIVSYLFSFLLPTLVSIAVLDGMTAVNIVCRHRRSCFPAAAIHLFFSSFLLLFPAFFFFQTRYGNSYPYNNPREIGKRNYYLLLLILVLIIKLTNTTLRDVKGKIGGGALFPRRATANKRVAGSDVVVDELVPWWLLTFHLGRQGRERKREREKRDWGQKGKWWRKEKVNLISSINQKINRSNGENCVSYRATYGGVSHPSILSVFEMN